MIAQALDPAAHACAAPQRARDRPAGAAHRAWTGATPAHDADRLAAQGALAHAARLDPAGYGALARGHLERARAIAEHERRPVLGAEALMSAGAVRHAVETLSDAHARGDGAATLALARRLHHLGAHADAARIAAHLPGHAGACLIRARAALAAGRAEETLAAVGPVLEGTVPGSSTAQIGACAVLGASALARTGADAKLERFARALIDAPDLDDALWPYAARVAWTAGEGARAWTWAHRTRSHGAVQARVELALLAGDAERAAACAHAAGTSPPGLGLLSAEIALDAGARERLDDPSVRVHVWCTSDRRYAPWIETARASRAEVTVWDWRAGVTPARDDHPDMVLEDAALIAAVEAKKVRANAKKTGSGVHIHRPVCEKMALGLEWPEEESAALEAGVGGSTARDGAAWVVGPPAPALEDHARGCGCVVIAPPGDAYWSGPLAERTFERLAVVRADPAHRWRGAGARVLEALARLGREEDEGG